MTPMARSSRGWTSAADGDDAPVSNQNCGQADGVVQQCLDSCPAGPDGPACARSARPSRGGGHVPSKQVKPIERDLVRRSVAGPVGPTLSSPRSTHGRGPGVPDVRVVLPHDDLAGAQLPVEVRGSARRACRPCAGRAGSTTTPRPGTSGGSTPRRPGPGARSARRRTARRRRSSRRGGRCTPPAAAAPPAASTTSSSHGSPAPRRATRSRRPARRRRHGRSTSTGRGPARPRRGPPSSR